MASWTDNPATNSTPIRVIHINELRRTVDRNRNAATLTAYPWWDGPQVSALIPIRARHFTEIRDAITQYMPLGNWSVGTAPAADGTRPMSARDINDLRTWTDQFSAAVGLPSGPAVDPQGVTSFSFDPTQTPNQIVDNTWIDNIVGLRTARTPTIQVRSIVRAGDNSQYYSGFSRAFQAYASFSVPTYAIVDTGFHAQGSSGYTINDPIVNLTNPYITDYSNYLQSFAAAMVPAGQTNYFIWNEPNDSNSANYVPISTVGGSSRVDPLAALLYQCYTKLKQVSGIGLVYMGGILWPYMPPPSGNCDAACATGQVVNYLTAIYNSVEALGVDTLIPWDALNVHIHNCGFTGADIRNLRLQMDAVRGAFNQGRQQLMQATDATPIVVGEWGPTHDEATNDPTCLGTTLSIINTYFDAMWYFQHPNLTNPGQCVSGDYGLTTWKLLPGSPYSFFATGDLGQCAEWEQLQAALG